MIAEFVDGRFARARFSDDLDVRLDVEGGREAHAHHEMVINDQNTFGLWILHQLEAFCLPTPQLKPWFPCRAGCRLRAGTHRLCSLAHIEQSKMPGRERRNKAAAVVAYAQAYLPGSVPEFNRDLGRAAMFDGVGDGLLSDSQQVDLNRRRQTYGVAIRLEVDPDAIRRDQRLDNFCQCRD